MANEISNKLSEICLYQYCNIRSKKSIQDNSTATSCNACFQAIYCSGICKKNDLDRHETNCDTLFLYIQLPIFKVELDGNSTGIFNEQYLVDILFKFYKPLTPK